MAGTGVAPAEVGQLKRIVGPCARRTGSKHGCPNGMMTFSEPNWLPIVAEAARTRRSARARDPAPSF